jgi:hypothetical protein
MIKLSKLLFLQLSYVFIGVSYLLLSAYQLQETGQALSAAPILPAIIGFVLYSGFLLLPRIGMIKSYRFAMFLAIILMGGGGVVGNIVRYMDSGLEHYANFLAFAIAVAINSYGTVLNTIAALGLFKNSAKN